MQHVTLACSGLRHSPTWQKDPVRKPYESERYRAELSGDESLRAAERDDVQCPPVQRLGRPCTQGYRQKK